MAEDQHAFAEAVRDLLVSLDMGEELGPESGRRRRGRRRRRGARPSKTRRRAARRKTSSRKLPSRRRNRPARKKRPANRRKRTPRPTISRRTTAAADKEPSGEARRPGFLRPQRAADRLQDLLHQARRDRACGGSLPAGGAGPAARFPRQAARQPARRGGAARQPAAAPAARAAEPRLGLRPRGGHPRSRRGCRA